MFLVLLPPYSVRAPEIRRYIIQYKAMDPRTFWSFVFSLFKQTLADFLGRFQIKSTFSFQDTSLESTSAEIIWCCVFLRRTQIVASSFSLSLSSGTSLTRSRSPTWPKMFTSRTSTASARCVSSTSESCPTPCSPTSSTRNSRWVPPVQGQTPHTHTPFTPMCGNMFITWYKMLFWVSVLINAPEDTEFKIWEFNLQWKERKFLMLEFFTFIFQTWVTWQYCTWHTLSLQIHQNHSVCVTWNKNPLPAPQSCPWRWSKCLLVVIAASGGGGGGTADGCPLMLHIAAWAEDDKWICLKLMLWHIPYLSPNLSLSLFTLWRTPYQQQRTKSDSSKSMMSSSSFLRRITGQCGDTLPPSGELYTFQLQLHPLAECLSLLK